MKIRRDMEEYMERWGMDEKAGAYDITGQPRGHEREIICAKDQVLPDCLPDDDVGMQVDVWVHACGACR